MKLDFKFYQGKRVFVTGHTGFKGSWLCRMLIMAGAQVTGYALKPSSDVNLFDMCNLENEMKSVIGDIRDYEHLKKVFDECAPEIVIHMAAQPIVRESYQNPAYTYEVNVMGTVNIMECLRLSDTVKSFINVTTDKVYLNKEWEWGYRENEELNGYDPYSNSKSCSELITGSYKNSFFQNRSIAITTCRAGNVIGGGDFAPDRIIPDCIRAVEMKKDIIVRNPYSIRPYQHVLEPLAVYLMIAQMQYEKPELAGSFNVGPDDNDCWTTGDLVGLFCKKWKEHTGESVNWIDRYDGGPHEANFLKLDCSKLKSTFGWKPVWDVLCTMDKIVEWSDCYFKHGDVKECMKAQIEEFCN